MILAGCWRLETSFKLFYDFIKMKIQQDQVILNSWHIPFLIVLSSHFQKKMKHWNFYIFGYWVQVAKLKSSWNLVPVFQIVQKITEYYCPCLYISTGKVWWLRDLWFKRYIQKCTLSQVLILIMTSQIL